MCMCLLYCPCLLSYPPLGSYVKPMSSHEQAYYLYYDSTTGHIGRLFLCDHGYCVGFVLRDE